MAMNEKTEKYVNKGLKKPQKFWMLFLIGFLIIFIGTIILIIATIVYGDESMNFGAVIFIWIFPIVIGAGPQATLMILISIILAILSIIAFFIFRKK
ncbi:MAG: hypothetical protein OEY22_09715 [Candidatus Bathyarchaeota archaeon]|nr:hypothetical protein [Candidatus Bathyarchaeota archaeon]MDH5787871.1 hypothetical protein [Candidatus Bathyarchaeota archaeon]